MHVALYRGPYVVREHSGQEHTCISSLVVPTANTSLVAVKSSGTDGAVSCKTTRMPAASCRIGSMVLWSCCMAGLRAQTAIWFWQTQACIPPAGLLSNQIPQRCTGVPNPSASSCWAMESLGYAWIEHTHQWADAPLW